MTTRTSRKRAEFPKLRSARWRRWKIENIFQVETCPAASRCGKPPIALQTGWKIHHQQTTHTHKHTAYCAKCTTHNSLSGFGWRERGKKFCPVAITKVESEEKSWKTLPPKCFRQCAFSLPRPGKKSIFHLNEANRHDHPKEGIKAVQFSRGKSGGFSSRGGNGKAGCE